MLVGTSSIIVAIGLTMSNLIQTLRLSGYKIMRGCNRNGDDYYEDEPPPSPPPPPPQPKRESADVIELYCR